MDSWLNLPNLKFKGKENAEQMFRVVDDDIDSPYKIVPDIFDFFL